MKKKFLLVVSILFAILFISTISFATNDVKEGIHNVTDGIVDGTENLGRDVRSGIGNAENVVERGAQDIGGAIYDGMNDVVDDTNDGYTATRTTASDMIDAGITNSSMWVWVTLAIATAVIIGLVWYYGTQNTER